MASTAFQFVQQSETGWIVSLGNGAPSGVGRTGVSVTQLSRTAGADAKLRQASLELDESAYSWPAIAEGTSCKVVFDGVLYNRAELSGRLATSSTPAANDADLVLRAYLKWGEDVLGKVKGIFAL